MTGREAGFTLIEMLASIIVTAMIVAVAMGVWQDFAQAGIERTEITRLERRAAAVLDRVARDLEGTLLVQKAPETDPLEHPWLFLGESRGRADASNRIKFMTRGQRTSAQQARVSDFAQVAYWTEEEFDGELELWRWSWPHLPEDLDRSIPRSEDDGTFLLADGLSAFDVRFMDEEGEWIDEWDSSTLAESGQLPFAVEVSVSLISPWEEEDPYGPFVRRVVLPMRPIDLQAQLQAQTNQNANNNQTQCQNLTVRECAESLGNDGVTAALPEGFDFTSVTEAELGLCMEDSALPFDSDAVDSCL